MIKRLAGAPRVWLGLLVAWLGCAPVMADPRQIPYALTISGGISLGAYEAGLNWALLRYLKQGYDNREPGRVYPRLVAVTGASAGSINGLISALAWCVDEARLPADGGAYADRVDANLFRDIWLDVGFDNLLPAPARGAYLADDGLLTRKAFADQIARLRKLMRAKIYRPGCHLPLALLVTRETPSLLTVAGLQVQSQRHVIPLLARGREDGGLQFEALPHLTPGGDLGLVIHLPPARPGTQGRYAVAADDVIDAVLASSAFPFAFGRKRLRYCLPADGGKMKPDQGAPHYCPPPLRAGQAVFLDGGVFDNVPLGSTRVLAEAGRRNSVRRINYIFMDPGHRRAGRPGRAVTGSAGASGQSTDTAEVPLSYDLASQGAFVPGFFGTAQGYELYKVLTSGKWDNGVFALAGELIERLASAGQSGPGAEAVPDCRWPVPDDVSGGEALRYLRRCAAELEYAHQYLIDSDGELRQRRQAMLASMAVVARGLGVMEAYRARLASARHDSLADRRILLSSRFYPITGEYLGHFGAFFDHGFRLFDYYAGIYDAVNDIARYACQFRRTAPSARGCREGEVAQQVFDRLALGRDANARWVFFELARREHGLAGDWAWLAGSGGEEMVDGRLIAIVTALDAVASPDEQGFLAVASFDGFVRALQEAAYPRAQAGEYYLRMADNGEAWWNLLALRSVDRLLQLEDNHRRSGGQSYFHPPLKLLSRALHIRAGDARWYSWQWRSAAVAAGYSTGSDFALSWRPIFAVLDQPVAAFTVGWWRLSGGQPARDFARLGGEFNFDYRRRRFGLGVDYYRALQRTGNYGRGALGVSVHHDYRGKWRWRLGLRDLAGNLVQRNGFVSIGYLLH